MIRALILLRNKSLIPPNELLLLFFELLRCQDKPMRSYLKEHMIADIKNINAKQKNSKLNTTLQNFMFSMLSDSNAIAAKISLDIMIELYRKGVWQNAKTVNVISTACFSKVAKIMATALKFFLGKDENADGEEGEDFSDSDDEDNSNNTPTPQEVVMANRFNKKTRKRQRLLDRTKQVVKKFKKKDNKETFNFSAIHLLHDPQTLAERLFKLLESFNERFELKLMLINFISRLIGIHQLFVLNFFPYLQRYLHPRQQNVTKLLQYLAQASHELTPPDLIEPILKIIANNFVTERNSNEVMAVGINSIREICARCPLAMNEDLLQDLVEYNSYRDKNVSMSAKSLVQLFRVVNPSLLKKKDRGRPTEATDELKVYGYGENKAVSFVPGAEILEENKEEETEETKPTTDRTKKRRRDEDSDEDSDDSWIDIPEDDDEEEEVEDEEDDQEHGEGEHKQNKLEKAMAISSTRILTQEEFQKVKLNQISKQIRAARPRRFNKSKEAAASTSEPNVMETLQTKEIVQLNSIERLYKRSKADREARLESIKAGREDRGKFGGRKEKMNEFASKNKKEQQKTKNFMMVKHKLCQKRKKSFREKQMSLRNALLKRCKKG